MRAPFFVIRAAGDRSISSHVIRNVSESDSGRKRYSIDEGVANAADPRRLRLLLSTSTSSTSTSADPRLRLLLSRKQPSASPPLSITLVSVMVLALVVTVVTVVTVWPPPLMGTEVTSVSVLTTMVVGIARRSKGEE